MLFRSKLILRAKCSCSTPLATPPPLVSRARRSSLDDTSIRLSTAVSISSLWIQAYYFILFGLHYDEMCARARPKIGLFAEVRLLVSGL